MVCDQEHPTEVNASPSLFSAKHKKLIALDVKIIFTAKILKPELQSDIITVMLFFAICEACINTWEKKKQTTTTKNTVLFTTVSRRKKIN